MVNLGTLPDFQGSSASSINNRGQVVGWLQAAEGKQHAALWQQGKMYDLNTLIPHDSGWFLKIAADINEKGQIVGYGTINGAPRAYLLTPQRT
jgi:probable HAF family extracellular repeat protein